jgi:dolichol kinase
MCRELLRGPLYYVIVLLIIVLVFWRDSPIGIVSLSMMSGGDGKMEASLIRHGSRFYKTPIYVFVFAESLRLLGS